MDQNRDIGPSPAMIQNSWVVPLAALLVAALVIGGLAQPDARWNYQAGAAFVIGFIGGWTWQWTNPRDFVDRFGGWALLVSLAMLLLFLPGSQVDLSGAGFAWIGIPLGVIHREKSARMRAPERSARTVG